MVDVIQALNAVHPGVFICITGAVVVSLWMFFQTVETIVKSAVLAFKAFAECHPFQGMITHNHAAPKEEKTSEATPDSQHIS